MVFVYAYDAPAKKLTVTDVTVYEEGERSELVIKLLSDGQPVATFSPEQTVLEHTVPTDGLRKFTVAVYSLAGELLETGPANWQLTTEYAYEKAMKQLYPALDTRTGTDWFDNKQSLIDSIKFHTVVGNYPMAKDLLKDL